MFVNLNGIFVGFLPMKFTDFHVVFGAKQAQPVLNLNFQINFVVGPNC
jgi:hypothetical protein